MHEFAVTAPTDEPRVNRLPEAPITWADARQLAFECASPLPAITLPLAEAHGRELTCNLTAVQALPHYASSAMDGWAVNGSGPWVLSAQPLTETKTALQPDQAIGIATGGLVPEGATAVIRRESGCINRSATGTLHLTLRQDAKLGESLPGHHIRRAGEEAKVGEVLIPAGTILNPAHIALAAVAGHDELQVQAKPRIALILTGSEVITAGVPERGKVRDAFGPQLGAVISQLGGIASNSIRIGDSYEEWLVTLVETNDERHNLTITTGGTGRSSTDHFRNAVAHLGGKLLLDGIAMRPGHPAVLAELPSGHFILGLPGNPLAAMMALMTIGGPLIAALENRPLQPIGLMMSGADQAPDPSRTRLIPCTFLHGLVFPASHTGPGMMRGLARADGFMAVPPCGVESGELVPVLPLPWTTAALVPML